MERRAAAFLLAIVLLSASLAFAAPRSRAPFSSKYGEGREVAAELTKVTGVSISPLLGATVLGFNAWLNAPASARDELPWYQRPSFFVPGVLLLLVLFVGHRLPFISRLAKLLKVWEDKLAAALAVPIVADTFAVAVTRPLAEKLAAVSQLVWPSAHAASGGGGVLSDATLATSHAIAWVLGVSVGAIVWLASHTVDVLVLVSPLSMIDWLLKSLRALLLGALVYAALRSPWLGLGVSAVYILVALVIAGWTFRLFIFEVVFSRDLLGARWKRAFREGPLRAFSSSALAGVPARTMGAVVRTETGPAFRYRPWLVRSPRTVPLGAADSLAVGRGLVSPVLLQIDPERETGVVLARFAPRYRLDSRRLARILGLPLDDVRSTAATTPIGWLREQTQRQPEVRAVQPASP